MQLISRYESLHNRVANPYPSPIDIIPALDRCACDLYYPTVYCWDPRASTAGQFVAAYSNHVVSGIGYGGSATVGGLAPTLYDNYYIPANTSYQVRALPPSSGTVTRHIEIHEDDKVDLGSDLTAFKSVTYHRTVNEFVILNSEGRPYDFFNVVVFDNPVDHDKLFPDAGKLFNEDFNVYTVSENHTALSWEFRSYQDNYIIPIQIRGTINGRFTLNATNIAMPIGKTMFLHDKNADTYTEVKKGMNYDFDFVGQKDADDDRFELIMRPSNSSPTLLSEKQGLAYSIAPNPTSNYLEIVFSGVAAAKDLKIRILSIAGVEMLNKTIPGKSSGNIKLDVQSFAPGMYIVEVISGDEKYIERIMKQ